MAISQAYTDSACSNAPGRRLLRSLSLRIYWENDGGSLYRTQEVDSSILFSSTTLRSFFELPVQQTVRGRALAPSGVPSELVDPAEPVPRLSARVCEGQHSNRVLELNVRHVIREAPQQYPSYVQIFRYARHARSQPREFCDACDYFVRVLEQPCSRPEPGGFVPQGRIAQFGRCLVLETNRLRQLWRSFLMRSRTDSQGSPALSPRRTRLARRSISAAQAASTSGSGSPSSVASSSAARSARSSAGNRLASSSRARDRSVIKSDHTLAPGGSALVHGAGRAAPCIEAPASPK